MAIDTAEKRLSLINVAMPFRGVGHYPDADRSIGPDDRLALMYLYAGIAAGSVVTPPPVSLADDPALFPKRRGRRFLRRW